MKAWLIAPVAFVAIAAAPAAQAQISIDVSKITCRQLLFDKTIIPHLRPLTFWLSGYYNGKRGNTVVDIGAIEKNRDTVEDYCRMNQDVTVMEAIERALGAPK